MFYLCTGIVLSSLFLKIFFFNITDLSVALHKLCLSHSPDGPYKIFYQALACGQKPQTNSDILLLKQLGIIHILVVSGFHILMLNKVLHFLLRGPYLIFLKPLFLFIFVMTCQFQLPVVRAWIQSLLVHINRKWNLQIPKPFLLFLSILSSLIISFESYRSLSLPMSWVACLGIQFGRNNWSQSLYSYLLMLPIISSFAVLSPLTVVINSLFAPLIGLILFPLSLLSFFISGLSFYVDKIWFLFLWAGKEVAPLLTNPEPHPLLPHHTLNWLYPFLMNMLLIHFWKRAVQ